jgi:hypothetical protein
MKGRTQSHIYNGEKRVDYEAEYFHWLKEKNVVCKQRYI